MPSKSTGKVIYRVKVNKKDIVITFSDRSKLRLEGEVLANFYLYPGKTLSSKEMNAMKNLSSSAYLLKYAMSLLKKGHYSEWKMREKLYAKEGKKKDVDRIIKMLKNNDLINDEMFALDYAEYMNEKNYGKNKIVQDLSNKGIFESTIKKIKFSPSLEKKKAKNQMPKLEKKYHKYAYEQKRQHIFRALVGLGFDNDVALETVNKMASANKKEETNKLQKDLERTYIRFSRKYEGYDLKNKVVAALRSKGYKVNDILREMEKKYGENDF